MTSHVAHTAELDPVTLYQLLKLRVDVFVVEQECAYPELDGRDVEPQTLQLWLARAGAVIACLRLLTEPDASTAEPDPSPAEPDASTAEPHGTAGGGRVRRIGRVAVAAHERGRGHGGRLIEAALAIAGDQPCVLDAQAHLTALYARHGFVVAGPEYVEDGIPHVPMRRPPGGRRSRHAQ
ncbi:GNAT family N-acetyltransferase [Solwaraspora sp. WMMD791]|uniref:GNAT family N-acetyltransferase n=1 Tax=Solwaraspora sp. WMMD791 TaxID=3016086 RepID=UPI00249B8252|nr:GNAT family N-acetyltransferase [Solwaraspora sp. WMMD791]WFE30837.1 GNAT family N-acetyltransferase [Solwaraspora sp. WMMD791]